MTPETALYWTQTALTLALTVSAPLLGVALAVGLAVSLFQAMTSIQEMTLSMIPKMLAVAAVLFLLSPWMLEMLTDFSGEVFRAIAEVSH
ncbi:flagellar biosynthesis protein FliQ [Rubrivirga sp. IMCC43871]|uniref:flagellar biosynthesis protein FliQ n=1 Tax=Rubrivirga sp. IMCC43871 TaxID=3391575 RepID=UPI00398F92C0